MILRDNLKGEGFLIGSLTIDLRFDALRVHHHVLRILYLSSSELPAR